MIDRDDFNKGMDQYISVRKAKPRSGPGIFYFFNKQTRQASGPRTHARQQGTAQGPQGRQEHEKELETMEAKLEEVNEIEDAVEERREGLLKGFFRKLRIFNREETIDQAKDEAGEAAQGSPSPEDEDVKRVLKLTYGWLNELPEEKIVAFKDSEDFTTYKRVLGQYGLLKQKGTGEQTSAPADAHDASPEEEEDAA